MKKNLFILFAVMLMIFAACKKNDDVNPDTGGENPAFTAPYSSKAVSEQKDDIADASLDLADELEDLATIDAFAIIMNMIDMMSDMPMPAAQALQIPAKAAEAIQKSANPSEITDILKASGDDYSIQDIFDEMAGEYAWNFTTEEFELVAANEDAIIINFPGTPEDITNNATVTLDNVAIIDIVDPIEEWPEEIPTEVPTSLNITLEYDGTEIMSFVFSAAYNNEGMPTSLSAVLTIEEFSFSTVITHTPVYQNASIKETFKHSGEILVETFVEANGNWTMDNINANLEFELVCDPYYTDDCWEELTDESVENIINNGNAYIQVMDMKIVGYVDILTLKPAMETLDENETLTDQQRAEQTAILINSNVELVLVYVNPLEKIAEVEAYAYYNEEDEYWDISARLKFADGSTVDAETFAEEELDEFITSMGELLDM
jgi:hypothetical protein